jgi:hypothetical protein
MPDPPLKAQFLSKSCLLRYRALSLCTMQMQRVLYPYLRLQSSSLKIDTCFQT